MATVSTTGDLSYLATWDLDVRAECPDECLVCQDVEDYFNAFSYIDGDVYIVGK